MSKSPAVVESRAPRDGVERKPAPQAGKMLLRAEQIQKTYRTGPVAVPVLRGCDLRIAGGEFVAIMGKSGSGKSTLLHVLGALDVPEKGQVYFRDEPIFAPAEKRWLRTNVFDILSPAERRRIQLRRRQFGFVFQFYHLLPELNVLENVLITRMVDAPIFGWLRQRAAAREKALAILERVGLTHRLKHRPNELSGGERQRVAIARALVHSPEVLLADEPTGNLDAEAGGALMGLLRELHGEGQTIVMVTHDATIAAHADRTLHLESGRLKAPGA